MAKVAPYISKSKYLWGLQCHKLLWFAYNAKQEIPKPDESQQSIFDQGHQVGTLAKQMFPDGIEIGAGITDLRETIRLTQEALKHRKPLFEASFTANGGYARADILNPVNDDAWDFIEVKSSSSLKEEKHLPDVAFQTWVQREAGLKVRRCYLCHINKSFVRKGAIDSNKFFVLEDVTEMVGQLIHAIEDQLDGMFKNIRKPQHPEIKIGSHCSNPYPCPLHDRCWDFLPEQNVLELYRGKKKGFALLNRGVERLADIPDGTDLTANQEIQKQTAISGKPHLDKKAIRQFLTRLEYPLHFLDFETYGTAIPMFDGVKPYQQLPFQYSLHIVGEPGAQPEHHSFLADGKGDPRPELMSGLRNSIGCDGSIVAYNAGFELARMRQCCDGLPTFLPWLKQVESRVVDLLEPFRSFAYYNPSQAGSASMKDVLPALTGKSYEALDIQEGGTASREYLRVTFEDVTEEERRKARKQLEQYCGQDTEGMVWIVEKLRNLK